jgi:hypothetical protein
MYHCSPTKTSWDSRSREPEIQRSPQKHVLLVKSRWAGSCLVYHLSSYRNLVLKGFQIQIHRPQCPPCPNLGAKFHLSPWPWRCSVAAACRASPGDQRATWNTCHEAERGDRLAENPWKNPWENHGTTRKSQETNPSTPDDWGTRLMTGDWSFLEGSIWICRVQVCPCTIKTPNQLRLHFESYEVTPTAHK